MICEKCGAENKDTNKFCQNCGSPLVVEKASEPIENSILNTPIVPTIQENNNAIPPAKPKKKKGLKAVIAIVIVIAILAATIAGDILYTKQFKKTIAGYQKTANSFYSMGEYKEDYDKLIKQANSATSKYMFWKYPSLNKELSSLIDDASEQNDAVAKYADVYKSVTADMESGTYVLGDYQNDYYDLQSNFDKALSDFDVNACKKYSEEFQSLYDQIIDFNKQIETECIDMCTRIKSGDIDLGTLSSCESYLATSYASDLQNQIDSHNYAQLYTYYNFFNSMMDNSSGNSSATYVASNFVQADVSEDSQVKLYFDSCGTANYQFQMEDFVVYEQLGNSWVECEPVSIAPIEGSMTIDIVADVSGSMDSEFTNMQNAIDGFIDYTDEDTTLGLSTICSIYERKQEFTKDKDVIEDAVWDLDCYGLTSLYQSLYSSVVYTASASGSRCVVAYTDGYNEPYGTGYDYDVEDVIRVANYYSVPVYIIGLGYGVDSDDLEYIAESTGGKYYSTSSASSLQNLYTDIYNNQGKMYELTYETKMPNNEDRDIYIMYNDGDFQIRCEQKLNASALQQAYNSNVFTTDNYLPYYSDTRYLSSDELSNLGEDLDAVQTIINIYFAKNGYEFGSSENGQKQLEKMISMGVIDSNGTLDGETVTGIIRDDEILWQNFSALYNYRYELIYSVAEDIYKDNPRITYDELRAEVMDYYNEETENRYDPVLTVVWDALKR